MAELSGQRGPAQPSVAEGSEEGGSVALLCHGADERVKARGSLKAQHCWGWELEPGENEPDSWQYASACSRGAPTPGTHVHLRAGGVFGRYLGGDDTDIYYSWQ
jgi:hypothetical protein